MKNLNFTEKINKLNEKQQLKSIKKVKRTGFILYILASFGLIATTILTLSGGYGFYKENIFKLFAFFTAIIFSQLMIFVVSTYLTNIKRDFNKHYLTVKLLQIFLLIVSIYYNYAFFNKNNLITFILCVCLDLSIIKLVSLSHDFRTLNYHNNNILENDFNLLSMILFNLTAKFRINTVRAFNFNKAQYKKVLKETENNPLLSKDTKDLQIKEADNIKLLENKQPLSLCQYKENKNLKDSNQDISKDIEYNNKNNSVLTKDKELLLSAIFNNIDKNNICPSMSKLENLTQLSRARITELKKQLKEEGILTTQGNKTIVNIDSLDVLN